MQPNQVSFAKGKQGTDPLPPKLHQPTEKRCSIWAVWDPEPFLSCTARFFYLLGTVGCLTSWILVQKGSVLKNTENGDFGFVGLGWEILISLAQ